MSGRVQFQFDADLEYQLSAVSSVVRLFEGAFKPVPGIYSNSRSERGLTAGDMVGNSAVLEDRRLFENLRAVQLSNGLFTGSGAGGNNFTVEMETGTGKTYVYLRTLLELFREYGFTKFMIVVPSIAIRKGVEKSISMLASHFNALYGVDLSRHSFIYDSRNPGEINGRFIESSTLSVCVMNIQAFNRGANKIRSEDEYGQILWRDIRAVRPVVIIDEPQKIEGTRTKKSASLRAIEDIDPLFILRYSATHKELYNQVYKLDSYDAFQMELVKGIEVKTVHGVVGKDFPYVRYVSFEHAELKAGIEIFSQSRGRKIGFRSFRVGGGDSLFELSGGLSQYAGFRVQEDPHKQRPLKVETPDGMFTLRPGNSNFEITQEEAPRIQIGLAIRNHLDKQMKLLRKGKKSRRLPSFSSIR